MERENHKKRCGDECREIAQMHEFLLNMSVVEGSKIPFKNYILEDHVDDFVQNKTGVSIYSNPIAPTLSRKNSPRN